MIKRDTIQRCIMVDSLDDNQGGSPTTRELKEVIQAHVSQSSTLKQITQYGISEELVLNVVTNVKLDESVMTRYIWSNKLFKIARQVKSGNEYFSVLIETNE